VCIACGYAFRFALKIQDVTVVIHCEAACLLTITTYVYEHC